MTKGEFTFIGIYTAIALIIAVFLWNGCAVASADEIPTDKAILAVIGEAENQGYKGMLAVSCAIRNRGTLKGVYGLINPRITTHKYSYKIYDMATRAWFASYYTDITNGATNWENVKAFGCPSWMKRCVETYRYKDHIFFKQL